MIRIHCYNCSCFYYIYHVDLKAEMAIKCNAFLGREKFSFLPTSYSFINQQDHLFYVGYTYLVKKMYTTSYRKKSFVIKLLQTDCSERVNCCLEEINKYLNLDIVLLDTKKYLDKMCFPCRHLLLTKILKMNLAL